MPKYAAARWLALLPLLMTGLAQAQTGPQPLPPPRMATTIAARPILMEPVIQREINLTAKQRQRLLEIESEVQQIHQGATLPSENGEPFDFHQMMSGLEEVGQRRQLAVGKVLSSSQKTRLFQLELQREGWLALNRPDVAGKIQLSRPQFEKVQTILGTMRQAQMQANFTMPENVAQAQAEAAKKPRPVLDPSNGFQDTTGTLLPDGGPMSFPSENYRDQATRTEAAVATVQTATGLELNKVLTAEQKKAFHRLLGPIFDFKNLDSPAAPSAPGQGRNQTSKASGKPR